MFKHINKVSTKISFLIDVVLLNSEHYYVDHKNWRGRTLYGFFRKAMLDDKKREMWALLHFQRYTMFDLWGK